MNNDSQTPRPVVKIGKDMKIRLLKACAAGELLSDEFPELFYVVPKSLQFKSDEELQEIIVGKIPEGELYDRD